MTMRRWFRSLGLACALLVTGVAMAAPAPPRSGAHFGWRYDAAFASWPGRYWRGPDQPPVEASSDAPGSWGTLSLGGSLGVAPQPQTCVADLVAPLITDPPLLNGAIGYDEWAQAAPVILPLDEGREMFLMAQRTATMLYVCLAAPFIPVARTGQQAELYLNLHPGDQTVGPWQVLLQATIDSPTHTTLRLSEGEAGHWQAAPAEKLPPALRAVGGTGGDGAWPYPVFEFAIPLDWLADQGKRPDQIGLMARLQTFSHGKPLPVPEKPAREVLCWPDGRSSRGLSRTVSLGIRPDVWGHLRVLPDDPQPGLQVPLAAGPMHVDGQIGLKEWKGAACYEYRIPGDQYRLLKVVRDDTNLYVAVRTRTARGVKSDEYCDLYLDPAADEGLRPHPDDRLFRMPLACNAKAEVLHYVSGQWEAAASSDVMAASYPINDYESSYEFALPLTLFEKPQAPNLAVEVSYELPPAK